MTGAMEKGVWRIGIAKLCPACIREMETEYIVRPTHEIVLDPAKDISEKGVLRTVSRKKPHAAPSAIHNGRQDAESEGAG